MPVCRLCLREDEQIVPVWGNQVEDLAKRIRDCVSINIKRNDSLPTSVCLSCVKQVSQWEIFKANCHKTNGILQKILLDGRDAFRSNQNADFFRDKESEDSNIDSSFEDSDDENKRNLQLFEEEFEDLDLKVLSNNIYKCDICLKEYDSILDYLDHQETHDGEPVFHCAKCKEVFNYRKDLVSHDQNHKTPCHQCGKMIMKSSMKLHLIKHTGKFKCDKCGGTFNSRATLLQHNIQVHTDIRNHVCESCGKLFSCQTSLRVHLRIHSDQRLYKCKQCDYAGRTASALYAHMATHANDLCGCEYCPKTFKSSRNLSDHLRRVHSKEKKHVCSYCNKHFVDKYMLTVHKRWHTGDRPYKCTLCEKAFIRLDGLKEHMLTHNPRTKYDCKHCGKKFTTKRGVTRHICSANLGS